MLFIEWKFDYIYESILKKKKAIIKDGVLSIITLFNTSPSIPVP